MDRARSRSLIPWAIRSHRVGAVALGVGFGVLVAILAPAYLAAAKAISGGLSALAAQAQPFAQSFQLLTGPVDRLDTIGGYLSYKVFPDIALLLAIYGAVQGAQVIRGSESRGLLDLWLAAGRTRIAIMRDRVAGFLMPLAVVVVLVYAGTDLGGALSHASLVLPALGQCAAVGLVAMFAFAVALAVAQLCHTARAAAGITSAYLVASFFVANMESQLGGVAFLQYLSPFHYYVTSRTLVPGIAFDWASMLLLLAAAAATLAAAWALYMRRDTGGVSLTRGRVTRAPDYSFHASAIWRRWLWLSWLAEERLALASWFAGLVAFTAVEAAAVPTVMRIVNASGGGLERVLASRGAALTPGRYLSVFLSVAALLVAAFTVTQVARWASDAAQHRTDVLLTQPLSMSRLVAERAAALLAASAIVAIAVVAGIWLGAVIGGYQVTAAGSARAFLGVVLLCFAIGGAGLFVVTLLRNGAATGVIAGLLVASFFLTTLAGLLSWPSWSSSPSVFDAFGSPYLSLPGAGSVIYLLALGSGGLLAAYAAMRGGARIAA